MSYLYGNVCPNCGRLLTEYSGGNRRCYVCGYDSETGTLKPHEESHYIKPMDTRNLYGSESLMLADKLNEVISELNRINRYV